MKVYTYTEARQNLESLLDQARREGAVRIRRRDGSTFLVQAEAPTGSPLDVGSVKTDMTTAEIIATVRESRERGY